MPGREVEMTQGTAFSRHGLRLPCQPRTVAWAIDQLERTSAVTSSSLLVRTGYVKPSTCPCRSDVGIDRRGTCQFLRSTKRSAHLFYFPPFLSPGPQKAWIPGARRNRDRAYMSPSMVPLSLCQCGRSHIPKMQRYSRSGDLVS